MIKCQIPALLLLNKDPELQRKVGRSPGPRRVPSQASLAPSLHTGPLFLWLPFPNPLPSCLIDIRLPFHLSAAKRAAFIGKVRQATGS